MMVLRNRLQDIGGLLHSSGTQCTDGGAAAAALHPLYDVGKVLMFEWHGEREFGKTTACP
jgi:hypothetical protein